MFELSKMFLLCLNYWKLETPTQYRQRTQKDDGTAYKVDYTRCGARVGRNYLEVVNLAFSEDDNKRLLRVGQVAVLLPRAPEQRQPPALRDHARVWPQFAQVHFHRDPAPAPGEVQGGEGQAAPGETHAHPHTLPQVSADAATLGWLGCVNWSFLHTACPTPC